MLKMLKKQVMNTKFFTTASRRTDEDKNEQLFLQQTN